MVCLAVVVFTALGAGSGHARHNAAGSTTATERRSESVRHRRAREAVTVYWEPRETRPRRAIVEAGAIFSIVGRPRPGAGCESGWAEVAGGGYACLDRTEEAPEGPRPVPGVLEDDVVPFVYVLRKDNPATKLAYVPPRNGARDPGKLSRLGYGTSLNADNYDFESPSRFQGRNLERDPIGSKGFVAGWAVKEGSPVHAQPGDQAPTRRLTLHTPLLVRARAEGPHDAWHAVREATGARSLGYMRVEDGLRYWIDARAVAGVASDETWVDIDLSQQMVALRRGRSEGFYVTLISAGVPERPTPPGIYRITHKYAHKTMGALPGSSDFYYIEGIPWTMYFAKEYALHAAYWHNEFGNRRSHGCVNLAPQDARHIYRNVTPVHQPGFFTTFGSDKAPGAIVRVREGRNTNVPDHRDED